MKLAPIIIILCILATISMAIKPTQSSADTVINSLLIEYPKIEFFKFGDVKLNWHVYNSSATWLNNTQASCNLHIYNNSGNHLVINNSISYDPTEGDFDYLIKKEIIKNDREYSYIIYCNTTKEQGFLSEGIIVRDRNQMQEAITDITYIIGTIISIIIIYFCIYLIIKAFQSAAESKEKKLEY